MDSLDKSQTHPEHQTKKLKNMVKSKSFKISIGLCIMFTLVVTVTIGFIIIKPKINSNNELRNEQTTQQTSKEHKYSKYR